MTDKEINYLSGLVRLDLLIEKADAVRDNEGNYHYKKTEAVTSLSKEICHFLSACDLKNDDWKDFVLNTFYQYDCFDELVIFMRTGFLNWKDPKFARKLVTVLVKARKVLQAYYFVFVQVDLSDNAQSLHEDYEGLFFYFIDQVISEGLVKVDFYFY